MAEVSFAPYQALRALPAQWLKKSCSAEFGREAHAAAQRTAYRSDPQRRRRTVQPSVELLLQLAGGKVSQGSFQGSDVPVLRCNQTT